MPGMTAHDVTPTKFVSLFMGCLLLYNSQRDALPAEGIFKGIKTRKMELRDFSLAGKRHRWGVGCCLGGPLLSWVPHF